MHRKIALAIFGLWLISITGLSFESGYRIRSSDALISFDIATMLTPSGLIAHFLLGHAPDLAPYYWIPVSGRSADVTLPLLSLIAVSTAGLWALHKWRH